MLPSTFFTDINYQTPIDSLTDIEPIYESVQGFNVVLRAKRNGKWHIIKALKPDYINNPTYIDLLRKEFEIGYLLDHPNIIRTIDFQQLEGLGYCVILEYIDGITLDKFNIHNDNAQKIISEICAALTYAHSKQIIHRDLKPQNILITHNGNNVKLIDFGLADADYFAHLKEPAGTITYAAPELLTNGHCDNRVDIYSLGVIFKCFFGKYIPLSIIRKATQHDLTKRYNSIVRLQSDLQSTLFVKRWRPVIFSASAIFVVVLAILLIGPAKSPQTVDLQQLPPEITTTDTLYASPPTNSAGSARYRDDPHIDSQTVSDHEKLEFYFNNAMAVQSIVSQLDKYTHPYVYPVSEPAPDFRRDSILIAKQIRHFVDSINNLKSHLKISKAELSDYISDISSSLDFVRSRFWNNRRHEILMAYKNATDRVADSVRAANPRRKVGTENIDPKKRFLHLDMDTRDSIDLRYELTQANDEANCVIWHKAKYNYEL